MSDLPVHDRGQTIDIALVPGIDGCRIYVDAYSRDDTGKGIRGGPHARRHEHRFEEYGLRQHLRCKVCGLVTLRAVNTDVET